MMWQLEKTGEMAYYTLPHWQEEGAIVYFSCRNGGTSQKPYDSLNLALHVGDDEAKVRGNRKALLASLGEVSSFVAAQQTHSKNIQQVKKSDQGKGYLSYGDAFMETDGLVTQEKELMLATFYADCLPLVCFDPKRGALGMAHAGWLRTYQNIGEALIIAMEEHFHSQRESLWFALGASIGPCCYEVAEDFYEKFLGRYEESKDWFRPGKRPGKYFFDNAQANLSLLMKAGIPKDSIDVLSLCTACQGELFFSHRASRGHTGRQGLLAKLRS